MKRNYFLLFFCIVAVFASAQIKSKDTHKLYRKVTVRDTVLVIIFKDITASTDLTYTGTGTNIKWYKYSNLTTPISSGTNEIYGPDDATGYVLDVDGKQTAIWVINYKNYLPVLNSIEADSKSADPCEQLNLLIDATIPKMTYQSVAGRVYELQREFTVKYQTLKTDTWTTDSITQPIVLPATQTLVTPPYCDTRFTIYGDQFATDLGMTPITKTGSTYDAIAVKCNLKTRVTGRSEINEGSRPEDKSPITYSAPIDVQFLSNANTDVVTKYLWEIVKNKNIIISRADKDLSYTFTDYGTYTVRLTVLSGQCSDKDSIEVNVVEAALQVPKAFSPNGDGINDEFRVAYKSLQSFECWVYNRWGRKVFYWRDPQKGWDGKINGKDATPGAYFYVIKASGYGLNAKNANPNILSSVTLAGDINLLRGKEH